MNLEAKSRELKALIADYHTEWFLGDLNGLTKHIGRGSAQDQLGRLSSPLRQLFYLGGLLVTSGPNGPGKKHYNNAEWNKIVNLLVDIESEYDKLFFPKPDDTVDEKWMHVRKVAMSSFLSYFNQGPLNYNEQSIEWVQKLFANLDPHIKAKTGLSTADFVLFYDRIDDLMDNNFDAFFSPKSPVKPDWEKFAAVKLTNTTPAFLGLVASEKEKALFHFMGDKGIANRFLPDELVDPRLTIEKISRILELLSCERMASDFIYYTSTKPGNPLMEKPIVKLDNGMYQVFDVKQIIHAVQELLEVICCDTAENTAKYVKHKGKMLENKIVDLLTNFFKKDFKIYHGYYVDGCEQDILILWKTYAFIIEAKGYTLREPLRDPDKAFPRIKDDFKASIGYGYEQTHRVEKKFIDKVPLVIQDNDGNHLDTIDTTKYDSDFSVIVNLESFGVIQNDLSLLLRLETEDDLYPWAIKLDDLEVFLLTIQAQKKDPERLVDYLILRDKLHGKLVCMDEMEVCGAFLEGMLKEEEIEEAGSLQMSPDNVDIFEKQYVKGMGFKNEKHWRKKKDGKHLFI